MCGGCQQCPQQQCSAHIFTAHPTFVYSLRLHFQVISRMPPCSPAPPTPASLP